MSAVPPPLLAGAVSSLRAPPRPRLWAHLAPVSRAFHRQYLHLCFSKALLLLGVFSVTFIDLSQHLELMLILLSLHFVPIVYISLF